MKENEQIYTDAICEKQKNGKYLCRLYTTPLFKPSPEVGPLRIKTPEGEYLVPASRVEEIVEVDMKRKPEIIRDVDRITIYRCHAVDITTEARRSLGKITHLWGDTVEIEPSKDLIMTKKVIETKYGKEVYFYCEPPI